MINIIFYAACATRKPIDRNDIRKEKSFTSFEEALAYEKRFIHDDDDWGVIANLNNIWFRVWKREPDTGELLVTDEDGLYSGWINAQPLSKYIKNHTII